MGIFLLTCTKCGMNFPEGKQAWKEHTINCQGRSVGLVDSTPKPVEKIKNVQTGFKRDPIPDKKNEPQSQPIAEMLETASIESSESQEAPVQNTIPSNPEPKG